MNNTPDSPRVLARKKREAKALKANMNRRKEAVRARDGAEVDAAPTEPDASEQ
jgi:hypothetical protein